jgi:hypothetical protein
MGAAPFELPALDEVGLIFGEDTARPSENFLDADQLTADSQT